MPTLDQKEDDPAFCWHVEELASTYRKLGLNDEELFEKIYLDWRDGLLTDSEFAHLADNVFMG